MSLELLATIAQLCHISFGADAYASTMQRMVLLEQLQCQKSMIMCVRSYKGIYVGNALADCVLATEYK